MEIKERINKIMKKMEHLPDKKLISTGGNFPTVWAKPLSKETVFAYEKRNHIKLPEGYRTFITTIAESGPHPFYGLYSIFSKRPEKVRVDKKFIYTVREPFNLEPLSEQEFDALFDENDQAVFDRGYIPLCHEGCGMYSILIVNTEDKDSYGTVWFYDIDDYLGIYPLIHPVTKSTMSFLDWLEYYVDTTLVLQPSEYFSYGQLIGVIK